MSQLVLIGAGSAVFSRGLIADLVRVSDPYITRLSLVDIDEDALAMIERLAHLMLAGRRDDIRISASTDRREALVGADYVVTTFAVGGAEAWWRDVEIARDSGIYLSVGDTVGPPGVSRVLRHVPLIRAIAEDVEELCPQAWLFNYANPMSCLVRAATMVRSQRTVGLCHGTPHSCRALCRALGIPADDMRIDCTGLNHCTWVTDLRVGQIDVLQRARQALSEGDESGFWNDQPFTREMFELHGAYPVPGDRHLTEFFPQFFRNGYYDRGQLGVDMWGLSQLMEAKRQRVARMYEEANGERPLDESLFRRTAGEHEHLLDIVAAIERNSGAVFTANTPAAAVSDQMPPESIIETPIAFGMDGWRPTRPRPLPAGIAGVIVQRAWQQELNVQAALKGDRRVALQALIADGWIDSVAQAETLLERYLSEQQRFLPQFQAPSGEPA